MTGLPDADSGFGGPVGWGRRPGLVVVDLAPAYFTPGSDLDLGARPCLDAAARVLAAARAGGHPVVHTRVAYCAGGLDGGLFFRKVRGLRHFVDGGPLGEPMPEVAPLPGEVVVTKQYANGFFGTSLATVLTVARVDTVVVVGVSTSGCVRATTLDALQHGFRPVVVREAVGDRAPRPHEANLYDLQAKYADVLSEEDVVARLLPPTPTTDGTSWWAVSSHPVAAEPPGCALLAAEGPLLVPGAYDALSARLVEQAGFDAAYMTGFGATASLLGLPDVGLLSLAEMVDNAGRMARAIDLPLISDADIGYGNAINVARTVQQFERAGVAAIHLEDQVAPKRCGHMSGKQVVPVEEMVEKVRAAVAARHDPDFVLIARTDARAVEGLDAALERAGAYRDAGADVLFVEAPESEAEVAEVAAAFPETALLFNSVERGRTPMLPLETVAELGFSLVIFPVATLFSATAAMQLYLAELRVSGSPLAVLDDAIGFEEFTNLVGLPETRSFENDIVAS